MNSRFSWVRTAATAFLGIVAIAARMDAVWIETAQLAHGGGAAGDRFSWRVAIDGDVAVATKPGGAYSNVGVASVFLRSGGVWTEAAQLVPTFGAADGFGEWGLAISGDTVAVGTQSGADSLNGAWVFVRPPGGWAGTLNESAVLKDAGAPIAFAGKSIVAGPFVFNKPVSGWSGTVSAAATLAPSDAAGLFGESVAASGDTVVIGAPTTPVSGLTESGKAYVFKKPGGGWSGVVHESAQLFPSNPAAHSRFAWAVAIDGKTAVVTSNLTQPGVQEGEGYVFVEPGRGWTGSLTENARLDASDIVFLDPFGWTVAISGDTVAIGDFNSGHQLDQEGAVYVYQRPAKGWSGVLLENQELEGADPAFTFGFSIAISGNTMVAGEPNETVGGNLTQGQAHVFVFHQPFVTVTRFLVEGPIRVAPGVPVEIRVRVESPHAPVAPTGTVLISDREGHACRTEVSPAGEGRCLLTFGSPGTFILRAHYLGNLVFRDSESPALPVLVRTGGR